MAAQQFHGLLVIDKPGGITSRDVVNRVQACFPRGTRIGHTGTLDPLATGVLVLCVGAATRLAEYVQMMPKTYHAGLRLGARSDTDDADGNVIPVEAAQPPAAGIVAETLATYVGDIEQTPPAFSAAKVKGRRAYELARRGESVTLEARPVRIHGISIVSYCYPTLEIEVRCSKGTYIRSLARDVGDRLGCGALVQTLRRTCVGSFNVEHALPLDSSAQTLRDGLHPIAGATVGLCRVEAGPEAVRDLSQGRGVLPAALRPEPASNEELCAAFGFDGTLIAVLTWNQDRGRWMPHKVMIM